MDYAKSNNLSIAFIRTIFPVPMSLFFYDRVTGLIDLGHHVRIFALSHYPKDYPPNEDMHKYQLLRILDYHGRPTDMKKTCAVLYSDLLSHPGRCLGTLLKSFDVKAFGRRSLNLSAYFLLKTYSQYQDFDIIYGITGPTSSNLLFLKKQFPKAKFVVNFAGYDFSSRIRRQGTEVYHQLFRHADLVISHSFYSRDCLIAIGCPEEKIVKHPVGINLSRFSYTERKLDSDCELHFITVGRLVEKKAHRIILSALSRVLSKGRRLKYHIVGDGELLSETQARVAGDPLLAANVIFHGYQPTTAVAQLLHQCHVFLQPSVTTMRWADQEDTTTTLLEAQATGMPVIASWHAGIPEVVVHRETGFLVPERNVLELANAIEFFLSNPHECSVMGKKGRRFMERYFDNRMLNSKLGYMLTTLRNTGNVRIESSEDILIHEGTAG
jgi:colanic acid/amylovoran biosynthesis glycosyltransferase